MFDKEKFLRINEEMKSRSPNFGKVADGSYSCVLKNAKIGTAKKKDGSVWAQQQISLQWVVDDAADPENGKSIWMNASIKDAEGNDNDKGIEITIMWLQMLGCKDLAYFLDNPGPVLEKLKGTAARIGVTTNDKGYQETRIKGNTVRSTLEDMVTGLVEVRNEVTESFVSEPEVQPQQEEIPEGSIELTEGMDVIAGGKKGTILAIDEQILVKTEDGPELFDVDQIEMPGEVEDVEEEYVDEELNGEIMEGSHVVWATKQGPAEGTVFKDEGDKCIVVKLANKKKVRIPKDSLSLKS